MQVDRHYIQLEALKTSLPVFAPAGDMNITNSVFLYLMGIIATDNTNK